MLCGNVGATAAETVMNAGSACEDSPCRTTGPRIRADVIDFSLCQTNLPHQRPDASPGKSASAALQSPDSGRAHACVGAGCGHYGVRRPPPRLLLRAQSSSHFGSDSIGPTRFSANHRSCFSLLAARFTRHHTRRGRNTGPSFAGMRRTSSRLTFWLHWHRWKDQATRWRGRPGAGRYSANPSKCTDRRRARSGCIR